MGDVDGFLQVPENLPGVHHKSVVVTEGEAGGVEVGAEDRYLHTTHDGKLVCFLYQTSFPFIQSVLFFVREEIREEF